ncbi:MAG: arginine deiminase family protein [bacterium]|nr:arginine deiminase family protein [bacterium]
MKRIAITHSPSRLLNNCELTFRQREAINPTRANEQHLQYRQALQDAGYEVRNFEINSSCPDSVFVEDVAVVLGEFVLLASSAVPSRQAEVEPWRSVLSEFAEIRELAPDDLLDGGDVLKVGKQLLVGVSRRTNVNAVQTLKSLANYVGFSVHPISVGDCLHLKTACTALDDETLLLNPAWINTRQIPPLRKIPVVEAWAANILRLPTGILASRSHPQTNEMIDGAGYPVQAISINELEKAEAGLTCMSLLFD